jgi:hypothetical protein
MEVNMATSLLDIVQNQAAEIDRLRAKIEEQDRGHCTAGDFTQRSKASRRKHRVRALKSWTPARCEKQSRRMSELWQLRRMDAATGPNNSHYRNGNGHIDSRI